MPDVIAINIVNFDFPSAGDFHTRFHLREDNDRDLILSSSLEIHFLNMVKWRKLKGKDIQNDPLHRWLAWFNESSPPELIAEVVKMDEAIKQADERMVYVMGDDEAIRAYEMRQMALSDYTSTINYAREEGMKEGMEKGIANGIEQSSAEIARKLKARGHPLTEITEVTGLSPEAVERL